MKPEKPTPKDAVTTTDVILLFFAVIFLMGVFCRMAWLAGYQTAQKERIERGVEAVREQLEKRQRRPALPPPPRIEQYPDPDGTRARRSSKMKPAPETGWTGAVIHHTGKATDTLAGIYDYHVRVRGWLETGYHFIIDRDGQIWQFRPLDRQGAHAATGGSYRNDTYIGIAIIAAHRATEAQEEAIQGLVRHLAGIYPLEDLERHHEKCPGPGIEIESLEALL